MPVAVRVDSVSKQYRIYAQPSHRLKESLTRGWWKGHREFWALKDISFEIEAGTTVGIIGPNGSGKSTLLQIITGTLAPTHGNVYSDGRTAAILELGAGFNLEFTGIENIFMNATLNGLSKKQTEALLPQIASFAELGDFLYQPLKTYSSGMQVRLAFAAAIANQPDILIIDEVLAVGDAVFQHRCTRRIKEMQQNGTTVLFVSHDPSAVRALCSRAILLNGGRVEADGAPSYALSRYQNIIMSQEREYADAEMKVNSTPVSNHAVLKDFTYRHGDGSARILQVELIDENGVTVRHADTGDLLHLRIRVLFHSAENDPVYGFIISNRHGINLYGTNTLVNGIEGAVSAGQIVETTFTFNAWLAPDVYSISAAVHSAKGVSFDWIDGALFFRIFSARPIEGVANLNAIVTSRCLDSADELLTAEANSTPS